MIYAGSSGPNNGGVGSRVLQPRLVGCQTSQSSSTVTAMTTSEDEKTAEVSLMSLSPTDVQEADQIRLYKNSLQELVQREGFRLPSYTSNTYGSLAAQDIEEFQECTLEKERGLSLA
ncbi:hypothetical protein RIF29_00545 [Crotalaria pallida]|uniref:Uncharacterized protein n=1 Tax=Crotalaria pallida TaxID=3830 RepID=A0AAN9P730_CROPI